MRKTRNINRQASLCSTFTQISVTNCSIRLEETQLQRKILDQRNKIRMSGLIKLGLLAVFIAVLSSTAAWDDQCCYYKRNWKQCAWRNINSNLDHGLIRSCPFYKNKRESYLRVVWNGNLRQLFGGRCSRWYFTFDGRECHYYHYHANSHSLPIDGVIYQSITANTLRVGAIEGYCGGIRAGVVNVEFRVGGCFGYYYNSSLGNAYTGWNSYSRIIVEEVDPPQP